MHGRFLSRGSAHSPKSGTCRQSGRRIVGRVLRTRRLTTCRLAVSNWRPGKVVGVSVAAPGAMLLRIWVIRHAVRRETASGLHVDDRLACSATIAFILLVRV